jgi:hypothetical protein
VPVPFRSFNTSRGSAERPGRWWLTLHIGAIIFDWKHLEYEPTGEHKLPGRRVSGNWSVINP